MTNAKIDEKVARINELEAQAAILNAEITSLKDELKKECDNRKVDSILTKLNKISYIVFEKHQVDSKALKADGLYEKYAPKVTQTRFTISALQPL